jgi:hypothetical protein
MGKRAFAVWLCLVTCVAAATPAGETADWRILCSRLRPRAFVGSIQAVKTPRVGLEGTYRLHIAPGAAGPGIASIEWILPAASDAPREIAGASVSDMAGFTTATTVRVVRAGDYQIVALVRAHGARPGTPATVFVRYLRVRPEGSFDSATPFPQDPAYADPFASNIVIKRQVGVDAAETRYSGSLSYHDDTTGFQKPIREAQVRLVERVTEGAFLVESNVHTLMTDVDGRFEFPPVLAANADGSARVYRLRALLDNDTLSLSPSSGGAYERDTEFVDAEPGAALDFELRWERADASHMAGHVFTAILDARDFLINEVSFTRDKIPVIFPSPQDGTFYAAESRRNGALGDERMEIAFDHANDRTAMLHEYGHAVMTPLYGNRFDTIPFGDFDGPHKLSTVSDEEFAISEGWAEFMAAAVDDDALNVTSFINSDFPNIETNFWYTGRDVQVGRNTEGENVEGAVASVLWDITDGPDSNDLAVGIDDDEIDSQFGLVWTIFGEARPYSVLTVRDEWLSRDYPFRDEMMAIFDDHSITGLAPSPDVNRDGIVDIADLVAVAQKFGDDGPFDGFSPDVNGDDVVNILDLVTVASQFGDRIALAPAAVVMARRVAVDGSGRLALPVGDVAGVAFSVSTPGAVTVAATRGVWSFEADGRLVAVATGDGATLPNPLSMRLTDGPQADVGLRSIEAVGVNGARQSLGDVVLTRPLAADVPRNTALHPNYPNPFNPETWIPFDLAEAADVLVTVYDSRGRVVRSWDLGRRDAGAYTGRDGAVYWDGRSATGDVAASGSYYVELRAGEHASVRRILLAK